jgi:hypothetical protein
MVRRKICISVRKEIPMADRFEQLKMKYQPVLNFIQSHGVQLQNLDMMGDDLLIHASVPSADLKDRVWDQIKLVDPNFFDLIADIQAPAAGSGCGSWREFDAGCANLHSTAGRQPLENQQAIIWRRKYVHENLRCQQRQTH